MDKVAIDIQQGRSIGFLTDHMGVPDLFKQGFPGHTRSRPPGAK